MTTVTATAQHDNGASRPFAFLPKRRRSKSHPHTTTHHEDAYEPINDIDDDTATIHPDDNASTSTQAIPQKHIFPTTTAPQSKSALKQSMHIDIPQIPLSSSSSSANPTPIPTFIRKKSGELVKPSLKSTSSFAPSPPSPSSAPARPRTTSAPATPSASKSVHFDSQLEHVKLFLAGQKPLAVSREGSPVDMDTTSASEAEPDSFGISSYPFPSSRPKPRFGSFATSTANSGPSSTSSGLKSSRPQTRMKLKLIQIYTPSPPPNPAVQPWNFDVRLESVRLSNPDLQATPSNNTQDAFPSLFGTILVHNKAFSKTVFFRYTLDDWNTVSEVSCKHVHTLPGGLYDRFEYRVKLIGLSNVRVEDGGGERAPNVPFKPGTNTNSVFGSAVLASSASASSSRRPYRMEFCVRYNVPGMGEWWDSNEGRNYVVEFEWESVSVSPPLSSALLPIQQLQQQQQSSGATKIVSPRPQSFTPNTGASPLLQRLARHSLPFAASSGTASPGHISPPPYTGPGSASMLDQRPPIPSPSFPPSFPPSSSSSYGHNTDYFSSNRPQAMHIPLRSRYDFGVSLREGAKIMGPAVMSPPLSSPSSTPMGAVTSPTAGSGSGFRPGEISFPTANRIMSPTPVHGQFRHALATPGKKLPSPPRSQAVELPKDKEDSLPPAPVSNSTVVLPAGSDASSHTSYAGPLSPGGRRHVRSWLKTSMSDEQVSGSGSASDNPSREGPWGKVNVRKTMSSPAGFAPDESVSPPPHAGPSSPHENEHEHEQQRHHVDGVLDDDDESEEDGIWFGRRSNSSDNLAVAAAGDDEDNETEQTEYDVVTNAMRSAVSRVSPLTRFQDLDVVLEGEEAGRNGGEDEDEDMEMDDSSSSSHSSSSVSSPTGSLTDLKEQNQITKPGVVLPPSPTTTMSSSAMWSLSSGDSSSSTSSSGVSFTPRVSTPSSSSFQSQFETRTLPLFNVKLARAVLSGTPRSASPSLVDNGPGNIDMMMMMPPSSSPPLSSLKKKTAVDADAAAEMLPPPVLMSSPSSEGSVTPKGEMLSPLELVGPSSASDDAAAGGANSKGGINLNSSSYYSLLNQFCFFTGSPKNQQPPKQNTVAASTGATGTTTAAAGPGAERTREQSPPRLVTFPSTNKTLENVISDRASRSLAPDVRRGFKNAVLGQHQSRSSSADPPSTSSSSTSSSSSPHAHVVNPGFGFNFGFGTDGFGSMMMNNDAYLHNHGPHNHHHPHHHHSGLPYGMLKSLGRSFSDPTETFPVRSSYGEQVSGGVS